LKERDHMENVDVDEIMILKWVLDCSGVEWIQVCPVFVQWWDSLKSVINSLLA
jgi:hypothetical protein